MSTGKRIAYIRKNNPLSQEAFGEMMGVSRQAISKWESDLSVPEIDNLVSIATQFNVSVGWLLGVEDENSQYTESGQNIAEEIKSYTGNILKKYRAVCIFIAILMGVFCIWNVRLAGNIKSLGENISAAYTEISDLNKQINRLEADLRTETTSDIFVETGYSVLEIDPTANTAKIYVEVVPSASDINTEVIFISGDISSEANFSKYTGKYSAIMNVPLEEKTVFARVTNDNEWTSALVANLDELYRRINPSSEINMFVDSVHDVIINDDGVITEGEAVLSTDTPSFDKEIYGVHLKTEKTELICYHNGKLISCMEMTENHGSAVGITVDFTEMFEGKTLKQWDSVYFTVKLTDNYGREFYSEEAVSCIILDDSFMLYPERASGDLLSK